MNESADISKPMGEDQEGRGFGGIKMASVEEIIAKARFNESYLNVNLGLSENIEDLAKHFQNEENGVCWMFYCFADISFCCG